MREKKEREEEARIQQKRDDDARSYNKEQIWFLEKGSISITDTG